MSENKKGLGIGEIRLKVLKKRNEQTGQLEEMKDQDGNIIEIFEIDLKQNVDLVVKGETVNFSTYKLQNGTALGNKKLNVTPVDRAIEMARKSVESGKLSQADFDSIVQRYEKNGTQYTLSVSSKNLA